MSQDSLAQVQDSVNMLLEAIGNNAIAIAEVLLQTNPDLARARDKFGETALHHAAKGGHEDICKLLIKHGVDVKTKNHFGERALHHAAKGGHEDICKLLMRQPGADVNAREDYGNTALHHAAKGGHEDICKLLINHGVDVKTKNHFRETALHNAAERGHVNICALLMQQPGADVNARQYYGDTALHHAAKGGHEDICKLLMRQPGADVNAREDSGNTALHYAAKGDHEDICKLLIKHGADVNAREDYGNTALHLASQNLLRGDKDEESNQICKLLLSRGAKATITNRDNKMAIDNVVTILKNTHTLPHLRESYLDLFKAFLDKIHLEDSFIHILGLIGNNGEMQDALKLTYAAKASKHYQNANQLIQDKQYIKAISEFNKAITLAPDRAEYYKSGLYIAQAMQDGYKNGPNPQTPKVASTASSTTKPTSKVAQPPKSKTASAASSATKLPKELKPVIENTTLTQYLEEGRALFEQKRWAEATAQFAKVLGDQTKVLDKANIKHIQTIVTGEDWQKYGESLLQLKQHFSAIQVFQEGCVNSNTSAQCKAKLKKQLDDTKKDFTKLPSKSSHAKFTSQATHSPTKSESPEPTTSPSTSPVLEETSTLSTTKIAHEANKEGVKLSEKEEHEAAYQCFLRAVEYSPNNPVYHSNAGSAAYNLERFIDAQRHYRNALKRKSDNLEGYHENYADALERELENDPKCLFNSKSALMRIEKILSQKDHNPSAFADCDKLRIRKLDLSEEYITDEYWKVLEDFVISCNALRTLCFTAEQMDTFGEVLEVLMLALRENPGCYITQIICTDDESKSYVLEQNKTKLYLEIRALLEIAIAQKNPDQDDADDSILYKSIDSTIIALCSKVLVECHDIIDRIKESEFLTKNLLSLLANLTTKNNTELVTEEMMRKELINCHYTTLANHLNLRTRKYRISEKEASDNDEIFNDCTALILNGKYGFDVAKYYESYSAKTHYFLKVILNHHIPSELNNNNATEFIVLLIENKKFDLCTSILRNDNILSIKPDVTLNHELLHSAYELAKASAHRDAHFYLTKAIERLEEVIGDKKVSEEESLVAQTSTSQKKQVQFSTTTITIYKDQEDDEEEVEVASSASTAQVATGNPLPANLMPMITSILKNRKDIDLQQLLEEYLAELAQFQVVEIELLQCTTDSRDNSFTPILCAADKRHKSTSGEEYQAQHHWKIGQKVWTENNPGIIQVACSTSKSLLFACLKKDCAKDLQNHHKTEFHKVWSAMDHIATGHGSGIKLLQDTKYEIKIGNSGLRVIAQHAVRSSDEDKHPAMLYIFDECTNHTGVERYVAKPNSLKVPGDDYVLEVYGKEVCDQEVGLSGVNEANEAY